MGAGAGAAAWGLWPRSFSVEWDLGPAVPLTERILTIHRGDLPAGTSARLRLTLTGPGLSEEPIADVALTLGEGSTAVSVLLGYAHPRLVPGLYAYRATVETAASAFASESLTYTLHRFTFGV